LFRCEGFRTLGNFERFEAKSPPRVRAGRNAERRAQPYLRSPRRYAGGLRRLTVAMYLAMHAQTFNTNTSGRQRTGECGGSFPEAMLDRPRRCRGAEISALGCLRNMQLTRNEYASRSQPKLGTVRSNLQAEQPAVHARVHRTSLNDPKYSLYDPKGCI